MCESADDVAERSVTNVKKDSYSLKGGSLFATPSPGEEVVISGLAGTFPDSKNIKEFEENLFNKVSMLRPNGRLSKCHPEIPPLSGTVPDIDRYDAGFFGVHERQSHSLDVLARIFQEKALEAIFDAGLSPSDLEGTRTGVYVGLNFAEHGLAWFYDDPKSQAFAMTGNHRSMIAHRLSYFLKLKGPSFAVDAACSSSHYGLESAYKSIRMGEIDAAIVAGMHLCLHPYITIMFLKLGALSTDGSCRPFDIDGKGYSRSEAVTVAILQKSKNAKRVYAQIVHIKTNCDGFKQQGFTFPSIEGQMGLMRDLHEECNVDRLSLAYMETHGTGTPVGDPVECESIDRILATGREKPLLIGSVKSNMGHAEGASGFTSITKCIIAMESGYIPPNINFKTPRDQLVAIKEGRMQVVVDKVPLKEDNCVIGINNFGIGGTNGYVLMKRNSKKKTEFTGGLPKLVAVSGRTKDAVNVLLDQIERNRMDSEYIGLMHEVFRKDINNHLYRGYSIVSDTGTASKFIDLYSGEKKILYFAVGNLENWCDVGRQLMELAPFSDAIHKIQQNLILRGVNILEAFNGDEESKSFIPVVGATTVLIALVEVLNLIDIKCKASFGFSVGRLVSSYYNKVLTLEETIDLAFSVESEMRKLKLPLKSTDMEEIILSILMYKRLFNKDENICNLMTTLATNEYKEHSVVLGIGDGFVDSSEDLSKVLLFQTGSKNCLVELLMEFGRLYLLGYNPQFSKLYPPVNFPVGRGTPMISPYIRWNHSREKFVPQYGVNINKGENQTVKQFVVDLKDNHWTFIAGHVLDGNRNVFPLAGYLYLVWDTFVTSKCVSLDFSRVYMENCKFLRVTQVPAKGKIIFKVVIAPVNGNFKIFEGSSLVATGNIHFLPNDGKRNWDFKKAKSTKNYRVNLNGNDFYKELRLKGYNYSKMFRGIEKYDPITGIGRVRWENNWVAFMDNVLQTVLLRFDTRLMVTPTFIPKVEIATDDHRRSIQEAFKGLDKVPILPVYNDRLTGIIRSGGVTFSGMEVTTIAKKSVLCTPVLETYEFVPNLADLDLHKSVKVNVQIILENTALYKVKAVELSDEFTGENTEPLAPILESVLTQQPGAQFSVNVEVNHMELEGAVDYNLVVVSKISIRPEALRRALDLLTEDGFVISREKQDYASEKPVHPSLSTITVHRTPSETLMLFKRQSQSKTSRYIKIDSSHKFSWLSDVQAALNGSTREDLVLYSDKESTNGILGMVNCLRREPGMDHVRCLFVVDDSEEFDPKCGLYQNQLKKNLTFNVYKNGCWGTYRHLTLAEAEPVEREHCYVDTTTRGNLSSLSWMEGPLQHQLTAETGKELIYVYYSSLNQQDVLVATGKTHGDNIKKSRLEQSFLPGNEFSGRNQRGQRVMGATSKGSISNLVLTDSLFVYDVPNSWTLEEAATVPLAYTLAAYALITRGQLKMGESILIHSAGGGMGQAAIRIALYYGCQIFVTVDTKTEHKFLKIEYPQLEDENITDSHSYEHIVYSRTKGRGVDLVLSCSSEEESTASAGCLGRGGRLLQAGIWDLTKNISLGLQLFQKEASFHGITLDAMFSESTEAKQNIKETFYRLMREEVIIPLNRIVFGRDQLEEAFRYAAPRKHVEKVLIRIRESETQFAMEKLPGIARFRCDSQGVYVILGGLGGFGLELVDWLILRGARKLVLVSKRGIRTGYQNYRLSIWKSYGVQVKLSQTPLDTREGCKQILEEALEWGPLLAIFNTAMTLADATIGNQTPESFTVCMSPKAFATRHMDELTRKMCPDLREFVVFSSLCCGIGNSEQTNYGMANSVMERICEKRKREGYPGLAIQWGYVGQVGLIAENRAEQHSLREIVGTLPQPISSCLQVLDVLLTQNSPVVTSMVPGEKHKSSATNNLVDAVTDIMGLTNLKYISLTTTLAELGMDSMLATEIRQMLERNFQVIISTEKLRTTTMDGLKQL